MDEVKQAPEAMIYILKHNLLQNGTGYTLSSLEDEKWEDLLYEQICMASEAKAMEMEQKKAQFYGGKEIVA